MENREGKKEYKKLFFIDYEQKKIKKSLCIFVAIFCTMPNRFIAIYHLTAKNEPLC